MSIYIQKLKKTSIGYQHGEDYPSRGVLK